MLLAAVAARAPRVELATGLVSPARRNVLHMAALGATMHACFGPRFVLGLGRGDHSYLRSEGLRTEGFDGLCDYVAIVERLWAGETVAYEGPAGQFDGIKLGDVYQGEQPKVVRHLRPTQGRHRDRPLLRRRSAAAGSHPSRDSGSGDANPAGV